MSYSHTLSACFLNRPATRSTCSSVSSTCKVNRRWKTLLRWESTVGRNPRCWNLREALSEPSIHAAGLGLGGTGTRTVQAVPKGASRKSHFRSRRSRTIVGRNCSEIRRSGHVKIQRIWSWKKKRLDRCKPINPFLRVVLRYSIFREHKLLGQNRSVVLFLLVWSFIIRLCVFRNFGVAVTPPQFCKSYPKTLDLRSSSGTLDHGTSVSARWGESILGWSTWKEAAAAAATEAACHVPANWSVLLLVPKQWDLANGHMRLLLANGRLLWAKGRLLWANGRLLWAKGLLLFGYGILWVNVSFFSNLHRFSSSTSRATESYDDVHVYSHMIKGQDHDIAARCAKHTQLPKKLKFWWSICGCRLLGLLVSVCTIWAQFRDHWWGQYK